MLKNVLKLVLSASVICLVSSCNDFNWKPRPWQPSHELESIISPEGDEVLCGDPLIETFTCFDEDNIAELQAEIRQLDTSDKQKRKLLRIVDRLN